MTTYRAFADALLGALGAPITPATEDAIVAWEWAEQGGSPNAADNPLNIQAGNFAHVGTAGTGQYDFAGPAAGVTETAAFLGQPYYASILAQLRAGNGPGAIQAIQDSPWAAGHYGYHLGDVYNEVSADPGRYDAGMIADAPGGPIGDAGAGASAAVGTASFLGLPNMGDIEKLLLEGLFVLAGAALVVGGAYRALGGGQLRERATRAAAAGASLAAVAA